MLKFLRKRPPASPATSALVRPPTISWPSPGTAAPRTLRHMRCPTCGGTALKTLTLTIDVQLPDHPTRRLLVLRCPDCTAHLYDRQEPPDYADPALNNRGRVPFYVQQGAGVSLITRPLAQLPHPRGSTYMEVGCGYGFGLDFALSARGWKGVGIDPAPLSEVGRDALEVPIELRYLREDDEARGTMDIVMGSEVVEHVTDPPAFVRTLKAMLKPGGVLVLTTPNGDYIAPSTPPGILVPLLSPSLHMTLQNPDSLRYLLLAAGFRQVSIREDGHSMVAYASDAPIVLEDDPAVLRAAYRGYLLSRARRSRPDTDVFLGFAGRAFQECVNDGEMAGADEAWAMLHPVVRDRFGIDLSAPVLPESLPHLGLEDLARAMPISLGGLIYATCIRALAAGTPRPMLAAAFRTAAAACVHTRRALGELAMEDGQTEDLGWTAGAEAALCAVVADEPDAAAQLLALPPAPAGAAARTRRMILRGMIEAVNAGHYDLAQAILDGAKLTGAEGLPDDALGRDVLFCMAVLKGRLGADGRPVGDPAEAARLFAGARKRTPPSESVFWAALRGELQALDSQGLQHEAARVAAAAAEQAGLTDADVPEDVLRRYRAASVPAPELEADANAAP